MRRFSTLLLLATCLVAAQPARAQPGDGAPPSEQPAAPPTPKPAQREPPKRDIQRPNPLGDTSVAYPEGAEGDGRVVLELVVQVDGSVRDVTVESGDEPFASAAREAAKGWRFEPARVDGTPREAKIRFEVLFREPQPEPEQPEPPATPPDEPSGPESPDPSAAQKPATPPPQKAIEVDVYGDRPPPGRKTMTRAEVRELPGAFGDPFRALEVLPGVTPIVSGVPFFFVRGAPPGNVGYYLDNIRVPVLYHVGLGPSVVHPGLVDRVDLYSGGYPAQYGRYAGGIVAGETTQPRADFHGEANLRLIDAGLMVENGFDGGRGTALVGGRYSYTGLLLSLLSPEVTLEYWDYQGRVTYDTDAKTTIGLFSFGSFDLLAEDQPDGSTETIFATQFHRLDLRATHRANARTTLFGAATLGIDRTNAGNDDFAIIDRMVATRGMVDHRMSERVRSRSGYDVTVDFYELDFVGDEGDDDEIDEVFPSRRDISAGIWSELQIDVDPRVRVTPGLRTDVYVQGTQSAVGIDPRLAATFTVRDNLRLVHALGIAHQPPSFPIPIPGLTPTGVEDGLQRAVQHSAGVQWDLPEDLNLEATLFQSTFFDMTDVLGASNFEDEDETGDENGDGDEDDDDGATELRQRSLGHTVGLELSLRRALSRRIGGFFGYTLSRSTRSIGRESFPANFDRTHVVNLALAFNLGKRWRAGTRAVFYSGRPSSRRNADGTRPQNPERLPPFFRLDLRLEKRWRLGKSGYWAFVIEVLNSTLSTEPIDDDCSDSGCTVERVGPVTIPSIGLEAFF